MLLCILIFAKAYTVSCPAGLHYNPTIEKCDWPENTQCASQQNGGCLFNHETDKHIAMLVHVS